MQPTPHGQPDTPPSYLASTSTQLLQHPNGDRATIQRGDDHDHNGQVRAWHLAPWLGLRSRLFLSLFTPALASILLVIAQVLAANDKAGEQAQDAKDQLMSACFATEKAANVLASTPYYFATNFNRAVAKSINDTVHGLGRVMMLAVTAIEQLLIFLVDMYRSLLLCFIELLVRGSLSLLMGAVDALSGVVNDASKAIRSSIQGSIDGINGTLRITLGGINDILKLVGKSVTVPQINMPDLSALQNIKLPDSIDGGLKKLNDSLPTLADLKEKMDDLNSTPFEDLKREINSTISTYSFNESALPVPQQENLSFCNGSMDLSPIDDLAHDLRKAAHIGIGILILLIILLLVVGALLEWYGWVSLLNHVDRAREAFNLAHGSGIGPTDDNFSSRNTREPSRATLLSFLQLSSHPLLAGVSLRLAKRWRIRHPRDITRLRWWLAWISHPLPLAVLAMGIFGFLSVELQMAAIRTGERHAKKIAQGALQTYIGNVNEAVNEHLAAASFRYANESNTIILKAQDDLNNGVFRWVNVTTSTMNNTLNEFMDGVATAINATFASTPLFTPVQNFVNCILGQKVAGIEKALTWIHNNSHVDFPLVANDVLMLSPNRTEQALRPATESVVGDGSNGHEGLLDRLSSAYINGLKKQRTIFLCIIAAYFVLFLIGTIIAITGQVDGVRGKWIRFGGQKDENESLRELRNLPVSPAVGADEKLSQDHFLSPGVRTGHTSISQPLLPEVVMQHDETDRRRADHHISAFLAAQGKEAQFVAPPTFATPIHNAFTGQHTRHNASFSTGPYGDTRDEVLQAYGDHSVSDHYSQFSIGYGCSHTPRMTMQSSSLHRTPLRGSEAVHVIFDGQNFAKNAPNMGPSTSFDIRRADTVQDVNLERGTKFHSMLSAPGQAL